MATNSVTGTVQASADPTVSEDGTNGWGVGARWVNKATGNEFVCTDNSVGAAVWVKLVNIGVATALVAAGTVQGDALALTKDINIIATAASGTGVRLPAAPQVGSRMVIKNRGANTANIWPATGGTINAGAANAAATVAAAAVVELVHLGTNAWEAI